jgi:putative Mg2+ transporter-C (MgtC) family protein
MPSDWELILRLLLAGALAGALGVERELTDQPAGLRTHILVGLGASLFAIISAYGFDAVVSGSSTTRIQVDVTRVASQIVVGIGFLAGGVILKSGANIRGLTTAANLWITAAIGTAVGLGALVIGAAATAIALLALVGLRPVRRLLERYVVDREEFRVEAARELDITDLVELVRRSGVLIREVHVSETANDQSITLRVRLPRQVSPGEVASRIAAHPGVRNVDWSG